MRSVSASYSAPVTSAPLGEANLAAAPSLAVRSAEDRIGRVSARACVLTSAPESPCSSAPGVMPKRRRRSSKVCLDAAQASLLAPAPTAAFGGAHLAATPSLAARSAEYRIGRASARACAAAPTAPGSLGRSMPRAPQPSGPFPDAAVGKASALSRGGACGMSVGDGSESETPQRLVPAAARASSGMRREMSGPAARDGSSEDDVEMYAAPAPRLAPAPAASFDGAHLAATPSLGARSAEDRIGRASARACVTAPTVPGSLGRSTNRPSDAAAAARVASGMHARMAAPAARLEEDSGEDSEYSDAEAVEQRTATAPQRAHRFPEACMHSAQASLLAPAPTAAFGGAHLAATPSLAARSAEDRIDRASARACAMAPTAPRSLGRSRLAAATDRFESDAEAVERDSASASQRVFPEASMRSVSASYSAPVTSAPLGEANLAAAPSLAVRSAEDRIGRVSARACVLTSAPESPCSSAPGVMPKRRRRSSKVCLDAAQASLLAPAPTAAFGGAHLAATPSLAARSAEDRIGRASARARVTAPTAPGSLGRSTPRAPQPSGHFHDAAVGKASALPRGGACGMSVGDGSESETPQRSVP